MWYALVFVIGAIVAWYPTYRYYDQEKKAIGRALEDFHIVVATAENVRNEFANFAKNLKTAFHL